MESLKAFLVVLFIGLTHLGFAQNEETIAWSIERRLNWNDFKKDAPKNAHAAATTASGISYWFSTVGPTDKIEIDYAIDTLFYPNESWVQKDLASPAILAHEQAHFDIAELLARKMRRIMETTHFTKNVKSEIASIYKDIIAELNAYQKRYDAETNFSRNMERQLLWEEKIAKDLNRAYPKLQ